MQKKFLKDISANALQLIINQLCGLVIFFILSTRLNKADFGEFNWSLALLLISFNVLFCGIDQIVVRRIAVGEAAKQVIPAFTRHVWLWGLVFYGFLLLVRWIWPDFFAQHHFLWLLAIGKLAIFLSAPYKQWATGTERFSALLIMMVISNMIKLIGLIWLQFTSFFSVQAVLVLFVLGDMAELLVSVWVAGLRLGRFWQWRSSGAYYKNLLHEALPQWGTTVLAMLLTRIDWLLLGAMGFMVALAEYSFAYKVYEMATLPLLVIAPVLVPRFTRRLAAGPIKATDLTPLVRVQNIIATLVALLLYMAWEPVINQLTRQHYGTINQPTIFWLALSMPLLYFANLMWSLLFARGAYKQILIAMLATTILSIVCNLWLLPVCKGEGAAMVVLLTKLFILVIYIAIVRMSGLPRLAGTVIVNIINATAAIVTSYVVSKHLPLQLPLAVILYLLLSWDTGQLRIADWRQLFQQGPFAKV